MNRLARKPATAPINRHAFQEMIHWRKEREKKERLERNKVSTVGEDGWVVCLVFFFIPSETDEYA